KVEREVIDQLLGERIRPSRRRVQQVLDADGGHELQQRDVEAATQMNEKMPAEVGAVHLEPAAEPDHDEREQPPHIPGGKTRLERLPPAPRVGSESLMGEIQLHARDAAERAPEAE